MYRGGVRFDGTLYSCRESLKRGSSSSQNRPPHELTVNQISLDKFQFNLLPDLGTTVRD
jgi:hypothetical protein